MHAGEKMSFMGDIEFWGFQQNRVSLETHKEG